ncbi:MAG: hypothetical protein KGQ59_07260 [Bdellovibrionales bacterium]|nr:hypothetical protein [Bdellovibrionales bacterium]
MKLNSCWPLVSLVAVFSVTHANASLEQSRFFQADGKKTEHYISDGVVVGGDPAIHSVRVTEIRRSTNPKFERVVIDLDASRPDGELTALARPPYYQVSVNPEEKRIVYTIWGKPQLDFQAQKALKEFRKSRVIENIEFLPAINPDQWTFVLNLKAGSPVEVFDLTQPARIITDIRLGRALPK